MGRVEELRSIRDSAAAMAAEAGARRARILNLGPGDDIAELLKRNGEVERQAKGLHLQALGKLNNLKEAHHE